MKQGIFITFEGNDGAGKTTVCQALLPILRAQGLDVLYTREPGGSAIAESIRSILLDPDNRSMDPRTEALLYAASRAQHVKEIILPALQAGKLVLCDRFIDSSLAYQGYARNLGVEEIWNINQFAIQGHMPQKTLFFSVSLETGQTRMDRRGDKNRLDLESSDFHTKVRQAYADLVKKYPDRIVVINAEQDLDQVIEEALRVIRAEIALYE